MKGLRVIGTLGDGCLGRDDCDFTLLNWGVLIAAGGVWIGMLAALVASIVLLVRPKGLFPAHV